MDASNWIALGALVVSIFVAIRAELKLRAERGARQREDSRRDEELQLLRAQVEGQAEDRLGERQADLVCRQGSRGGVTPDSDEYNIELVNGGRATAHDVRAWIATDDGTALSDPQRPGAIPAGAKSPEFKLYLPHAISRDPNARIFLRAAWVDGAGDRERNIAELEHV
jgi:hypothetical protein